MSATGIQSVRNRHEYIADLMIMNPNCTQRQLSQMAGVTEAWFSTVIHSDAFKEYYECRREEHMLAVTNFVIERDDRSLAEQTQAVAAAALSRMEEKLEDRTTDFKLKDLTDAASKTLGALGFGSAPGGDRGRGGDVNLFIGSNVSQETLERARSKMLNRRADEATPVNEVIDGESEVSPTG